MGEKKNFWILTRRDLFKLLPPSLASWALASPLLSQPPRRPEAASAAPGPEAKIWRADWIWEPVEVMPHVNSPWVSFFKTPPFRNLFTFFRKTFEQPQGVGKALAQISADSRYQLYVNGHFVGRGPARFDPTWLYHDEFDLASVLRPGKNVIAVLVHYYGEKTGWYLDGGRPGLLFECSLEGASGGTTLVKTDATWKFLRAPMWTQDVPRINGALGFTELYDAAEEVEGWNLPDYDDAQWGEVHVISRVSTANISLMDPYPWDSLAPRDIPMLMEKEVAPSQVTFVGEVQNLPAGTVSMLAHQMSQETPGPLKNCTVQNAQSLTSEAGGEAVVRTTPLGDADSSSAVLVLDFGHEVTGRQRLELEGVTGGIVDMGVCESLANGRVTPTRNGLHFNRFLMRDGPQRWEAFEWDGFRYLQLTIRNCPRPIKLRKVTVNFTSYPVGNRGAFESSAAMLNKIWETSRYTVQLCMQDAYIDCPNREQRQWVGDAYVETKVNYSVFGDTKLAAKYLRQIVQSQRTDGILMMFWPGDAEDGDVKLMNIKDFVLHWISTVWEYYRFTGDQEMVRELFPNMVKALGWFEQRVNAQGLLSNITPWVFGDWAPLDRRDHNTILNALFYNTLREA
ncbi:MAG: family 78 glycoside hydrolase catalytic domain, partial [Terriglobia bacterium]